MFGWELRWWDWAWLAVATAVGLAYLARVLAGGRGRPPERPSP